MLIRSTLVAALIASPAVAGTITFNDGWQEQRLSLFSSNDYVFGEGLLMESAGTVSIAWTRLPEAEWDAASASWSWTVDESVPPTDLSVKGGDDRNLSVYFVFVPQDVAPDLADADIRALLGRDDVRVMQYAWGGSNPVGEVIPSPYGEAGSGVTIPLAQAGTGSRMEQVDLAADYDRAFGGEAGALIGLAVSGDSDDTESRIVASMSAITLE